MPFSWPEQRGECAVAVSGLMKPMFCHLDFRGLRLAQEMLPGGEVQHLTCGQLRRRRTPPGPVALGADALRPLVAGKSVWVSGHGWQFVLCV